MIEVRPDGRQIKIAQIRDLIRVVAFPPIEARVRVVIIEPADALGDEAANALLKTLEEPSSHTRFILCSSAPDALLVTIRSRCQRVVFGRLTVDEVAHLLHERFGVEARRATEVAAVSDGRVGHALALLEDPVMSRRAELLNRLLAISPGDTDACFEFAGELYELRQRAETLFDMLARLYRDVLMVRVGAEHAADSGDDELRAAIERTSGRYGTRALLARLELIEDTRHGLLDRNLNPRLSLERLVVALTSAAGDEGISFRVEALTRAGR